jgi:hypothetical protein
MTAVAIAATPQQQLAATPNANAQRQPQLLKDFAQLKPNVIPDTWV